MMCSILTINYQGNTFVSNYYEDDTTEKCTRRFIVISKWILSHLEFCKCINQTSIHDYDKLIYFCEADVYADHMKASVPENEVPIKKRKCDRIIINIKEKEKKLEYCVLSKEGKLLSMELLLKKQENYSKELYDEVTTVTKRAILAKQLAIERLTA